VRVEKPAYMSRNSTRASASVTSSWVDAPYPAQFGPHDRFRMKAVVQAASSTRGREDASKGELGVGGYPQPVLLPQLERV
jgi:hypothetical protein